MDLRSELSYPLSRLPRWAVPVAVGVFAAAVVVAVVVALFVAVGTDRELTPRELALEVCGLSGELPGPRWSGSGDGEQAQVRCSPEDAGSAAMTAALEGLGYEVDERSPVTDYLGNTGAWVLTGSGRERPVSVLGRPGASEVDVVVGASIHVHSDGEAHLHGPGEPGG